MGDFPSQCRTGGGRGRLCAFEREPLALQSLPADSWVPLTVLPKIAGGRGEGGGRRRKEGKEGEEKGEGRGGGRREEGRRRERRRGGRGRNYFEKKTLS